jgi:WD40 repeat protein
LSWSDDATLRLWNAADGAPIAILNGHSKAVIGALRISSDRLLSWSSDGTLRLWDDSGKPIAVWAQPYSSISGVVEVTPQRFAVLAGSHVMFVDIADGEKLTAA